MQNATSAGAQTASAAASGEAAELLACARLLAINLAEHRAKFGVIPLARHAAQIDELVNANIPAGMPADASSALDEALTLVRAHQRRNAASPRAGSEIPTAADKRHQLRISVTAPVQISDPDSHWRLAATMQNISWGGMAVRCKGLLGEVGQRVCVHLPAGRNAKIEILATVLRIDGDPVDPLYGLRFDSLAPQDEARLEQVLRILMSTPPQGGRRAEARLVQRLEIEYGDCGEFRATLEDISASGLMLTVPEPLEIDQSLLVTLSSADTPLNLSLRARVMHQATIGSGEVAMYRVGLQFEHPDEQLRRYVRAVLEQLAALLPSPTVASYGDRVRPLPESLADPTVT